MNVLLYSATTPRDLRLWGKGYWLAEYLARLTYESDRKNIIDRLTVILTDEQENEIERHIFTREEFES